MPLRLQVEVLGSTQLDRTFERLEGNVDLGPVWADVTKLFLAAERKQFASQGAFGSGGWAPLSASYARWKAQHFGSKSILRRTDKLFRSLTSGPEVHDISRHGLTLGSRDPTGRFHQGGTSRMPARPPVALPESWRHDVTQLVHRFVITGKT